MSISDNKITRWCFQLAGEGGANHRESASDALELSKSGKCHTAPGAEHVST